MAQPNRPRRSRKEVSYTSFDGNDDSDEDFATSTPPVSKKTKKEKPDARNKKGKDKPKTKEPKRKAPAERKAVDDRIFDKELELALEMSRVESASQEPVNANETEERLKDVSAERLSSSEKVIADIHIPEVKEAALIVPVSEVSDSPKKHVRLKAPATDDEITFIETVEVGLEEKQSNGRTRRRAATTAANKQRQLLEESDEEDGESVAGEDDDDGDGDFKADEEDVDSSDGGNDDDEGDEDFSFSPKKKKRKGSGGGAAKTVAKPKKATSGRQTKSPKQANENKAPKVPTVRKTPSRTKGHGNSFKAPLTASNSISKSPNIPPVRQIKRKPVVVSPKDSSSSNPLGGVKLVSPGQPFRLGLSRFARVKPLHSNVSVS